MPVFIRDAAAKYHPIIGIAALTSPVVQLRERDKWIGWSPELFTARVQAERVETNRKSLCSVEIEIMKKLSCVN